MTICTSDIMSCSPFFRWVYQDNQGQAVVSAVKVVRILEVGDSQKDHFHRKLDQVFDRTTVYKNRRI